MQVIVRFYQAEWLAQLPEHVGWQLLFRGSETPVANPVLAVITESKRFPLVWYSIAAQLPTWRALLPETHDPREVAWWKTDAWLLKTAMCNTGDTVSIRELMLAREWLQTQLSVWRRPSQWVAQRRFESVPVLTPAGPRHVCIGVYTVDGRAAGAYARLAAKPLVDFTAVDVALLIEEDD